MSNNRVRDSGTYTTQREKGQLRKSTGQSCLLYRAWISRNKAFSACAVVALFRFHTTKRVRRNWQNVPNAWYVHCFYTYCDSIAAAVGASYRENGVGLAGWCWHSLSNTPWMFACWKKKFPSDTCPFTLLFVIQSRYTAYLILFSLTFLFLVSTQDVYGTFNTIVLVILWI